MLYIFTCKYIYVYSKKDRRSVDVQDINTNQQSFDLAKSEIYGKINLFFPTKNPQHKVYAIKIRGNPHTFWKSFTKSLRDDPPSKKAAATSAVTFRFPVLALGFTIRRIAASAAAAEISLADLAFSLALSLSYHVWQRNNLFRSLSISSISL